MNNYRVILIDVGRTEITRSQYTPGCAVWGCFAASMLPYHTIPNVEWRKTGSSELVHLFQVGQSRPESQSYSYRDRAYFFTKSEIDRGNYSLLLRNLTTGDAGSYIYRVYTKEENAEIVVEIEAIGEHQTFYTVRYFYKYSVEGCCSLWCCKTV